MKDLIRIEEERLKKGLIIEAEFLNFKHCVENFILNTDGINVVEEKVYSSLYKKDTERTWCIYKNFQKVSETIVNESVYTDIKLRNTPKIWVTINMDALYKIKLDHLIIDSRIENKIFPKSKEKMRTSVINCNIIISTLFRCDGIYLYNRQKDDIDLEIKDKLKFTKGYTICINYETVDKMKIYEYYRKTISKNKTTITVKENNVRVKDYLKNKNYSEPIWVKNDNIAQIDNDKLKIWNNSLEDNINIEEFVGNINFLNSIKLSINKKTMQGVYDFIEKKIDTNQLYINKNKLIDNVYKINEIREDLTVGDDLNDLDFQKLANSASVLEIIRKQTERYNFFYISHAYDSRMRIYAQSWPVNYQLNHIIRASILINNQADILDVNREFYNNKIIKENYIKCKDSLMEKVDSLTKDKLNSFIKKEMFWKEENFGTKKECLIMVLSKIAPSSVKNINDKISYAIRIYEEFIKDDLIDKWEKWNDVLKIKKNKLPYIIGIKECLNKIKEDDFSETYWLDASSNAVQLIALRMGCKNEKLLMLTNIIDNKTGYENIYDYVDSKIKERNHGDLLNSIDNKITKEDIDSFRDREDSKYLIMPACYGMGKYKNRINNQDKLKDNRKWNILTQKEQNKISDYYWNVTFDILKEIEFDLEEYKKICSSFNQYDAFMWKNDVGLTVAPINMLKSKRQEMLKKQNNLKMKKENKVHKDEIDKKIERVKTKLQLDEKIFWKRTMIRINKEGVNKNIYIRVPNLYKRIDKRMTLQALTPNTIHAYDASVMFLCIMICKELGIEILVIHDCIGCKLIYAVLVKKIFKIANIEILRRKIKEKPFPMKNLIITEEELNDLKIKILESLNFFR
jgi:hypothetical protein